MTCTTITAAALALGALITPSSIQAEIVTAQCQLIRYGGIATPAETFPCEFRQSGGNVQVWSKTWKFEFLANEQGKAYTRINTKGRITFSKIGRYSLHVDQ